MKTDAKINAVLILAVALTPFAGCTYPPEQREGPGQTSQKDVAARRFRMTAPDQTTVVESTIELSDRYASVSQEAAKLRQDKQQLDTENIQLKEQLNSCRTQLEQSQKDLAEANDLLLEMRVELNNWKTDVIGFRDEMRDAEKAQLDALLKILKLLGADVRTDSPPTGSSATIRKTEDAGEQK